MGIAYILDAQCLHNGSPFPHISLLQYSFIVHLNASVREREAKNAESERKAERQREEDRKSLIKARGSRF